MAHFRLFIGHPRAQDDIANLLRISLSYLQQEMGGEQLVLQVKHADFTYVEASWIAGLWRFLSSVDGTITMAD